MSYADTVNAQGLAANGAANTGNPVKTGGVYNSTAPTLTTGTVSDAQVDVNGNLLVNVINGTPSGTAGTPSTAVVTIQGVTNMTPIATVPGLATSGGASYNNAIAPATPAVNTVKSSGGNIYGVTAFNTGSTPVYLKFYDASSVTLGTTAASFQYIVPGNTQGAGFVLSMPGQRSCTNAIKYAVTGAIATTDNTAISANTVIVDVSFK